MKTVIKDVLAAMLLGIVLPGILLNGAVIHRRKQPEPEKIEPLGIRCPVKVRTGDSVEEMELEDYIAAVVLAEMPASFEPEALKAQSVAARTYTKKAMETGGRHGDGSLCTDSTCCQAYIGREEYLSRGGRAENADKVFSACTATAGQVLLYDGELIEATYFSCSGGETESALAVWGGEIPYLQSVPSPEEEGSALFKQTLTFTPEEFSAALGTDLSGSPKDWFSLITYTEGGGVAAMTIGGRVYTGTQLRSLLGLRSTAFTLEAHENSITITTRGYGHRVGMSQYGADAMAAGGSTYAEILAHYYPGTELVQMDAAL